LKPVEQIESKYYLRINVRDETGVLAKLTSIFADSKISIQTVLQRPSKDGSANLLISTHKSCEKDIKSVIKQISQLAFVNSTPVMIRIKE